MGGSERATHRSRCLSAALVKPVGQIRLSCRQWLYSPLSPATWWAHLVGAVRVHPHKHRAVYPPQEDPVSGVRRQLSTERFAIKNQAASSRLPAVDRRRDIS